MEVKGLNIARKYVSSRTKKYCALTLQCERHLSIPWAIELHCKCYVAIVVRLFNVHTLCIRRRFFALVRLHIRFFFFQVAHTTRQNIVLLLFGQMYTSYNYRFISRYNLRVNDASRLKFRKMYVHTYLKLICSYFSLFLKYFSLSPIEPKCTDTKIYIPLRFTRIWEYIYKHTLAHTHTHIRMHTFVRWKRASHQIWFVFDLSLFAYATKYNGISRSKTHIMSLYMFMCLYVSVSIQPV